MYNSKMKLCLIISGAINCRRMNALAKNISETGIDVDVCMTNTAKSLFSLEKMEWSFARKLIKNLSSKAEHIINYDLYLVAPATYNLIGKIANGIADDAPTTLLSYGLGKLERNESRILFASELHENMYNKVYINNIKILESFGCEFIPPEYYSNNYNLPSNEILIKQILSVS